LDNWSKGITGFVCYYSAEVGEFKKGFIDTVAWMEGDGDIYLELIEKYAFYSI